ncbi:MAG: thioredoxin domain-containing protein [Planctomycetia bacterium]|nr:thioredoxin domain-containing protein [Planctomycetia bacterium]
MKNFLLTSSLIAATLVFSACGKKNVEPAPATPSAPSSTGAPDSATPDSAATESQEAGPSPVVDIAGGQDFLNLIDKNSVVLIDFFSFSCPPCLKLSPELDKMAAELKDQGLVVGKVNVDSLSDVAGIFGVGAIPDIRLFVDGKEAGKVIGYYPDAIRAMVTRALDQKAGKETLPDLPTSDSPPVADPNGPAEATPFPALPAIDVSAPAPAPEAAPEAEEIPTPAPDSTSTPLALPGTNS